MKPTVEYLAQCLYKIVTCIDRREKPLQECIATCCLPSWAHLQASDFPEILQGQFNAIAEMLTDGESTLAAEHLTDAEAQQVLRQLQTLWVELDGMASNDDG